MVLTCPGSISNSGAMRFTNSYASIAKLNYNRVINGDDYVNLRINTPITTNHECFIDEKKKHEKKKHEKKKHEKKKNE